jgi:hypothetical protein
MPERDAIERAERDKREGKSPSTQAGEFVRMEMDERGKGTHAPRSAKQAVAIGLSEARRAAAPQKGRRQEKEAALGRYGHKAGPGWLRDEPCSHLVLAGRQLGGRRQDIADEPPGCSGRARGREQDVRGRR